MNDAVLFLDGDKCVSCYNCVRACPVKAIIVEENSAVPRIDE